MTISEAQKKEVTKEEARKNLVEWLDFAAMRIDFSAYDILCRKAYKILGKEEYTKIWNKFRGQYVACEDGQYRRK